MMFQKKRFFENKKIRVRFSIVARQAKKTSSFWKIIEVTHLRSSGRGRGTGVLIFWKKYFFFFKIPDLALRPTSAPIVADNRRWMALQAS